MNIATPINPDKSVSVIRIFGEPHTGCYYRLLVRGVTALHCAKHL